MEGFTQIRNGIAEHLRARKLTVLEFGVYVLLHLRANFETGIYMGCALTLAYEAGESRKEQSFKHVLRRLKRKGYINYPRGRGERGGYPILIHKYEPTVGRWSGFRLDAWKHGAECRPEYTRIPGQAAESSHRPPAHGPESSPNKEIRPKTQDNDPNDLSKRSTEELRIMHRTFTRGGAKCPQSITDELARRGIEIVGGEGITIHAVAVGSFGKGKIGRVRVKALQDLYHVYAKRMLRAKVHSRFAREIRLAWGSTNLQRYLPSFSALTPGEWRKLVAVMVGKRSDLAWPKRRIGTHIAGR